MRVQAVQISFGFFKDEIEGLKILECWNAGIDDDSGMSSALNNSTIKEESIIPSTVSDITIFSLINLVIFFYP